MAAPKDIKSGCLQNCNTNIKIIARRRKLLDLFAVIEDHNLIFHVPLNTLKADSQNHLLTKGIQCNNIINMDIYFDWDNDKNQKLISERGVSFENVVALLEAGHVLDIIEHVNSVKYPKQQIYVIEIDNYVYFVTFIKDKNKIFLKTIFPNRKAQKIYLRSGDDS